MTRKQPDLPQMHRVPRRKPGKERFTLLLDTVEALMSDHDSGDISLADIAEKAGVPLSSIYHFFPNRDAAYCGLAERFQEAIGALSEAPMPRPPESWQALMEYKQRAGAEYLNSHPSALRLFLGAAVSVDVRNMDLHGNARLAKTRAAYMRRYFVLDHIPDLEQHLAVAIGLTDGIWAVSYSEHRTITPYYLNEAVLASRLYLRAYLPEYVRPLGG
ncbi:TetR/AcrR family transcriptional regulator [Chachezhania sediminis]|uniref:TetR/AcrR family transcriptional regulator n=1 Tax=Chachezhania sediminis TaxID=2599291 RepID=UPI00131DB551|nr:TetR/AcrR family transcriptional regulator [Chachezhania sediminis]